MALLAQDVALGSYPTGELCYLLLFSVLGCFRDRTSFVADGRMCWEGYQFVD